MSLRARCARLLLMLADAHGLPRPSGVALTIKLSQEEFADLLGRTRQSVNRELKQFEREGLIRMEYLRFTVCDVAALRAIADEATPGND